MLASGDRGWAAASRGGFGAAHVWALIVAVLAVAAFGLAAPSLLRPAAKFQAPLVAALQARYWRGERARDDEITVNSPRGLDMEFIH